MRASWQWMLAALWLGGWAALGLFVGDSEAQQKNLLLSKKVATPPPLEAVMGNAWKDAAPLTFKVTGGKNLQNGSTDVTMRSVHTDDMVYFLIDYKDPTLSAKREPWQKQAESSWAKLKDPNDKGGDNNLYYEDKISIFWDISSPTFSPDTRPRRACVMIGPPSSSRSVRLTTPTS